MAESVEKLDESRTNVSVGVLTAAGVVVVIAGVHAARAIVIPFLLALFIGVIISAILDWLRRRDINTGLAIFLLIFMLAMSSIIGISVVVSSVNEIVRQLPKLNRVMKEQESNVIQWMEDRGFPNPLLKSSDPETPEPQSLEIAVPGLVPIPTSNSALTSRTKSDFEQNTASTETDIPPPTVTTEDPSSSVSSLTSTPAESSSSDSNASNAIASEDMTDEDTDLSDDDIPVPAVEIKPFGIPDYMFGESRHVIEVRSPNPSPSIPNNSGSMLSVWTPVQVFQVFLESVVGVINYTLIVMLMLVFLLLEWATFGKKLEALPGDSQIFIDQVSEVLASIRRYMLIKTMVSLLTGLMIMIALLMLGADYAALWGIIAFLFNYIPTIGSMVAGIVPTLYVLVDQGPWPATYVALVFIIVNFLIGNLLEPRIMGQGLGLSTFVVFLSLIFWGWVLGPVGMLLAVPLTMMVKIALQSDERTRWLAILLGSRVVSETPPAAE